MRTNTIRIFCAVVHTLKHRPRRSVSLRGMAPKKKQKVVDVAEPATVALSTIASNVNEGYFSVVQEALNAIFEKFPNIASLDPLPESGAGGFWCLSGFLAPYSPFAYNAHWASGPSTMEYQCGINIFWQNILLSAIPWVPLNMDEVSAFAEKMTPNVVRSPIVLNAGFSEGAQLPRGALVRLSPDELVHALVLRVGKEIASGKTDEELKPWLRVMLSCPAIFKRCDTSDQQYAEANSCRQDFVAQRDLTEHTARQIVYNIHGFKLRKGAAMSASMVAEFWATEVRTAKSQAFMCKKSTVDTCLTLFERVFSVPDAESIICAAESRDGRDTVWASLWKLQEVVYRCGNKGKIVWALAAIDDWIRSEKTNNKEVTINSLKTGGKSLTDVCLFQLKLKTHLLSTWLDSLAFPGNVKEKLRSVFQSHDSYRKLYNPLGGAVADCKYMYRWSQAALDTVGLIEGLVYLSTPADESMFRQAVKNSNSVDEVLSWSPYNEKIQEIRDQLARLVAGSEPEVPVVSGAVAAVGAPKNLESENAGEPAGVSGQDVVALRIVLREHAERLGRHLTAFVVEPTSVTHMADLLKSTPLGTIDSFLDGHNMMIVSDINSYGESDSQPMVRPCSIPLHTLKTWARAILLARCGSDEPAHLKHGDVFVCISPKDRRREFNKSLLCKKTGKDKDRTFTRQVTMHVSEKSFKERKGRMQGHAKLTQNIYIAMNQTTLRSIPACEYPHHGGSNRVDIFGPVHVDPYERVPAMTRTDKLAFLGKRRVLVGGAAPEEDLDDDDPDLDADAEDDQVVSCSPTDDPPKEPPLPMNYHVLPVTVLTDLAKSHKCKHVIDFCPSVMPLAIEFVKSSVSYLGICGTAVQRDWLHEQLVNQVMENMQDPQSSLFDSRFASLRGAGAEVPQAGTPATNPEPGADPQPNNATAAGIWD